MSNTPDKKTSPEASCAPPSGSVCLIRHAAEIIAEEAQCLRCSHTIDGKSWDASEKDTKRMHDDMVETAMQLMELARNLETELRAAVSALHEAQPLCIAWAASYARGGEYHPVHQKILDSIASVLNSPNAKLTHGSL